MPDDIVSVSCSFGQRGDRREQGLILILHQAWVARFVWPRSVPEITGKFLLLQSWIKTQGLDNTGRQINFSLILPLPSEALIRITELSTRSPQIKGYILIERSDY